MFTLPEMKYDYGSLGSYISQDIMKLHHTKHHQTYVDKLNMALDGVELQSSSVTELLRNFDQYKGTTIEQAVRNHGGGHYNHSLFWDVMSPQGGGQPSGALADHIDQKYGSYQGFVDAFSGQAMSVFGSGWCWLMPDMSIVTTQNQDNPIMEGYQEPLMGLDVWEHAYYLDYKNKRDDYIASWWNVVDWDYIASRYNQ